MDRGQPTGRGRRTRANRSPTPSPPPPPPAPPTDQNQLFALVTNMMTMMQQQQQQNQQFLVQQQQQFFQQFAQQQQANAGQVGQAVQVAPAEERQAQVREVRLPEFTKLALEFSGESSDPAVAENW